MTDNQQNPMLSGVANLYSKSLAEHGLDPMSVGWRNADQQRLRFDKLATVLDGDNAENVTVNDWGCGYAAMFDYLDARLGSRLGTYYGYDISAEMLKAARDHVADQRAQFSDAAQVTEIADYSFVSGTFNVRLQTSELDWQAYMETTLKHLAKHSRRGFAFNVLSIYVDWKEDHLYYADPKAYFDFCKRNISKYVTLFHDYPLYEWTMYVRMP
jgi:hypothetical protein